MRFRRVGHVLLYAGFSLTAAVAAAQLPSPADLHYLREAIENNDAEMGAAQMALDKANADDVKLFARLVLHDDPLLNRRVRGLAGELKMQVANGQVSAHQQQVADRLRPLSGDAFERLYIAAMIEGNRAALNDTRAEAVDSRFPPVKTAAQAAAPIIQQHLQMALTIAQAHHVPVGGP